MFSSPFSVSAANDFVNSAMNARAVRQDMISGNIANIDTPMYRPRDISFEQVLKKEADKVYGAKEPKLACQNSKRAHRSFRYRLSA